MVAKSLYKPEYCKKVIEFMSEGYSKGAFAGSIGVSRDALVDWCKKYPEFGEAMGAAQAGCQLWWENMARSMAQKNSAGKSPAIPIFALKNMAAADWRDKVTIDSTVTMKAMTDVDDDL